MGRYVGKACRLCRRNKNKLFLKGEKCINKCVLDKGKKKNPPGEHIAFRTKVTEYARHLHEKQKLKNIFSLGENQLRNYYRIASKMKGLSGENLLLLLERRLDKTLCRMGFASSIRFANQLINHKHILVNGKIKPVSGYLIKPGDQIKVNDKLKENTFIKRAIEQSNPTISWIEIDREHMSGKVTGLPVRQDINYPIEETLIVEFYSR